MKDVDSSRVFTVMNDRSQAGSALNAGQIEFMQHRRIPADDGRGMGEWVDETDENGDGIKVPATYYLQIFDEATSKTQQRAVMHKTLDPAQYFFTFDLEKTKEAKETVDLSQALKDAGIADSVKMFTTPLGKNEILIRIENIADLYDKEHET